MSAVVERARLLLSTECFGRHEVETVVKELIDEIERVQELHKGLMAEADRRVEDAEPSTEPRVHELKTCP